MLLKTKHIHEFIFCVGYRHEQIRDHFRDGSKWSVSITYSVESQPLGTAGALKLAQVYADGPFLVLNGDTFFDLDVDALVNAHRNFCSQDEACVGTLALTQVEDPSQFGSVILDASETIIGFHEKHATQPASQDVSAGVYVLEPRIFNLIPPYRHSSLERDIFPQVLANGQKLCGHRTVGFFVDIGTPEGYYRFQEHAGGVSS
jgi:NDP-sugar pyrophosphorylase family protein